MKFYASVLAPLLFCLDAERAHQLAILALKSGIYTRALKKLDPILESELWGMKFPTPIGVAAGFDKNAEVCGTLLDLGFGFSETGTVTPNAQVGNDKPRMFRLTKDRGIINRLGFNNKGHEYFLRNVRRWHKKQGPDVIGVNIGKNKDTEDEISDFVAGVKAFSDYASYLVINVSSPNTPGLRDLQSRDNLTRLLEAALLARAECQTKPPLLVKMAPDLSEPEAKDIAEVAIKTKIDGIIVSNTTTQRPASLKSKNSFQPGGLSGEPVFEMSTQLLRQMYHTTNGKVPLIGVGGVSDGLQAYQKIKAGASLVQLYSGMIFVGPAIAIKVAAELAGLMKKDGFSSMSDIIGLDHR